jgi:hypothetical protein
MVNKNQQFYFGIIVLIVVAAIFGGYQLLHQDKETGATDDQNSAIFGQGQPPGGRFGGSGQFSRTNMSRVTGTLTAKDNSSLTIKTDSGNTTVAIDSSTKITQGGDRDTESLTLSDLDIGETVNAMGEKNTSGQIVAKMVFIGTMPDRPRDDTGATSTDDSLSSGDSI